MCIYGPCRQTEHDTSTWRWESGVEVVTGVGRDDGEERGNVSWWMSRGSRLFRGVGLVLNEVLQPLVTAQVE